MSKFTDPNINSQPRMAIFLDRDGTIIKEVNYLSRLQDVELLPGAAAAIARLNQLQIPVILVSNQSGIARGKFSENFVKETHDYLQEILAREGAHLDDFFFCPHHPEAGSEAGINPYRRVCNCRKPAAGMAENSAGKHNIDLRRSYVIGDKLDDVNLGRVIGAISFLVLT